MALNLFTQHRRQRSEKKTAPPPASYYFWPDEPTKENRSEIPLAPPVRTGRSNGVSIQTGRSNSVSIAVASGETTLRRGGGGVTETDKAFATKGARRPLLSMKSRSKPSTKTSALSQGEVSFRPFEDGQDDLVAATFAFFYEPRFRPQSPRSETVSKKTGQFASPKFSPTVNQSIGYCVFIATVVV
jgi:hypothetical protein